jgi:hypothetical protein
MHSKSSGGGNRSLIQTITSHSKNTKFRKENTQLSRRELSWNYLHGRPKSIA